MILRGAATGVVTTGSGGAFGLSVTDPARPDLAPSRPAYARVTGESYDTPKPPAFLAVTASGGRLQVTVHSEAPVDGYQIGISETPYAAPTVWWSTSSGSIDQEQTGGPWYLWARATYQGAFSLWSVYGQVRPEEDEWRLTWADESVSGTDHTAYPYATVRYGHTSGWQYATAGGMRIHQHTAYVDAYGLSTLAASGGVHGVRIDTVLNIGLVYPAAKAGVAWAFDLAAMAAAPTTTPYYGLCIRRDDGHEYLGLYHVVDQTATLLAEADVTAYMTSRTEGGGTSEYVDVSIQAREDAVTVHAEGVLVISATATGITWSDTLTGVGLWYQGSSNYGYSTTAYMESGVEDYLRVYARDHTGEPETITPGAAPHNDLDDRDAAACHPASAVSVTPSGGIAATDVQAALAELDSEKAAASHTHAEGDIQLSGPDVIVGRITAGAGGAEEIACTAAGRALLDDADAAAQRTTLGIASGTVWTSDNDGPGSGMDACSVDGIQGSSIAQTVSTTTTITVGPSGRDFTTIQAAWNSLKGKSISAGVTIAVDAGTYDPVALTGQPFAKWIAITGDTRAGAGYWYVGTGSITKIGDDCTMTLTDFPTGAFGVGDYVTVSGTTSSANVGRFPIVSVDSEAKTVTYTNAAGVAEAVLAGTRLTFNPNRVISRSTAGDCLTVGDPVSNVSGFTLLGTVSGVYGWYNYAALGPTATKIHCYGCAIGFRAFGGGNNTFNYCSVVGATYGIHYVDGVGGIVYYILASNCTYGMSINGRSDACNTSGVVTVASCTTGFYASGLSYISLLASRIVSGNGTDYNPGTSNTPGNGGAVIYRA